VAWSFLPPSPLGQPWGGSIQRHKFRLSLKRFRLSPHRWPISLHRCQVICWLLVSCRSRSRHHLSLQSCCRWPPAADGLSSGSGAALAPTPGLGSSKSAVGHVSDGSDAFTAARGEKLTPVPALRGPLQRQSPAQGLPEKPQPGRNPHGAVSPTAVHSLGPLSPVIPPGPTPASGGSSLWGQHRPISAHHKHPAPAFSVSGSASVGSGSWTTVQ